MNRRPVDKEGRCTRMRPNPGGPVDKSLPVLCASDAQGKPLAIVINYACHCTTIDGDFNRTHGDWAGVAQECVEADHPGVTALVCIGCGADANPEPRGKAEMTGPHGRAVADEVRRLLRGKLAPLSPQLAADRRELKLPLADVPTRTDLEARLAAAGKPQAPPAAKRLGVGAKRWLAQLDRRQPLPTAIDYSVTTWSFGDDLAMVFLPGEVVVDYALRSKRELDGSRLWVTAYANDVPCYVVSRRVLAEGGYEPEGSMLGYGWPAHLAPTVEDQIVETATGLLPKSFAAGRAKSAVAVGQGADVSDESYLKVAAGDLRIVVGEQASPPERRAAMIFAREVRARTGLQVPGAHRQSTIAATVLSGSEASAKYSLYIVTKDTLRKLKLDADSARDQAISGLGDDGFYCSCEPDAAGRLFVVGANPGNVLAAVGKLLRTSRYGDGSLRLPRRALADRAGLPVRGVYFATHFFNFYHVALLEEVDRLIEDCALWGLNQLVVWFDMHHFAGPDVPEAQKFLERLKHFQATAHDAGMQVGLLFLGNEGYSSTPSELRAKRGVRWWHYGVEVCPATDEGMALIAKNQAGVLDAFKQVDFVWSWPYDQGGCDCEKCRPWGCNGFLKVSEQLAKLYHQRNPKGKVWLSTWFFDKNATDSNPEYAGLIKHLHEKRPDWIAGIVSDGFLKPLQNRPSPERYPLAVFPEISEYNMSPWGGCGANPIPEACDRQAAEFRGKISGGWPYSEGIYEDLNKFLWAGFFWSPDRPSDEILAEYASYYLSPEAAADGVRLFRLLEKTLPRANFKIKNLKEAEEAWKLAQAIDARIPAVNRTNWRWRILCIRTKIDYIIKTQGSQSPEAKAALRPLCNELIGIYHAQAKSPIAPPKLDILTSGKPDPQDKGK
jgi:hypothetical protein